MAKKEDSKYGLFKEILRKDQGEGNTKEVTEKNETKDVTNVSLVQGSDGAKKTLKKEPKKIKKVASENKKAGSANNKPQEKKKIKLSLAFVKKNYLLIVVIILVLSMVLAKSVDQIKKVLFGDKGEKEQEVTEFLETLPVKCYSVKRMDFKDTLPAMGRIEGLKEIGLRFESTGILESFNFEEGERILEGDIIASINQKDALLKLKYAALELDKSKKMYDLGGSDKVAYEQKKLEYESAKRDLEKTNIYAPSDGYLGSKDLHSGSYITSQDKIGTFVEFSEVYAVFDVIEEDSPKLELGQNVEIFLDAYPGRSYKGTVDMIAPMIEGRTRTQKVRVEIENEDDILKPGMFTRGIINTYEKKDALIVPSSSFKKKENSYYVYVVKKDEEIDPDPETAGAETGTVEEREITIEYLTHDMAEIGKGLEEDELVIRELHQEFKTDDKVEITEVQETIF